MLVGYRPVGRTGRDGYRKARVSEGVQYGPGFHAQVVVDEERFVLGVVLEPETVDAQKDIYSAAEVREAAHRFMREYQNVGLMHRQLVNGKVKILESYVGEGDPIPAIPGIRDYQMG